MFPTRFLTLAPHRIVLPFCEKRSTSQAFHPLLPATPSLRMFTKRQSGEERLVKSDPTLEIHGFRGRPSLQQDIWKVLERASHS